MRVYVPTTPERLPGLREHGLPAGTEGYAVTPALVRALDLPADDPDTEDDLVDVVVGAAAEGSLLLLGEELPAAAGTADRRGTTGPAARRVVVVAEAGARAVDDPDTHPATVELTVALRWSDVESVLADDETASDRVARAAALVADDTDRAVGRLERDALGWFHPDEIGVAEPRH